MADISQYLQSIMNAVYGEDVRGSIHDAIEIINDVSEVVLSTGTAVDSASSSSTGFYTDSLYLNTNTFELWKCIGTDSWQSQGTLKGENGNGIASIEKTGTSGLVDTYTITYDDGDTDTFTVTNGEDGVDGNKWYRGTGISGKAVNPTVYSGSGITEANPNDFYLNPSEGAIYHCVSGGDPTVATWSFDFTMTGGGGGTSDYGDLTNKPSINSHTLSGNQTSSQLGLMGTGSVSWNQIQTSTGGTKIAEVTIEGTPTDVYAPTGGGGGASSLNDLSDVDIDDSTLDDGQILAYDENEEKFVNVNLPQGGHTMTPTPSASLTDAQIASAINTPQDGSNQNVVSAYSVQRWSNVFEKTFILQASAQHPFGKTGVGTWFDDDVSELTPADEADWWYIADIDENVTGEDIILDDSVDFKLTYDPNKSQQITKGGYIIDTDTGKICILFGNEITDAECETAKIGITLTFKRNEVSS